MTHALTQTQDCCIGLDGCKALSSVLRINHTLQHLCLSHNRNIDHHCVAVLAFGLTDNVGLRSLDLQQCGFGADPKAPTTAPKFLASKKRASYAGFGWQNMTVHTHSSAPAHLHAKSPQPAAASYPALLEDGSDSPDGLVSVSSGESELEFPTGSGITVRPTIAIPSIISKHTSHGQQAAPVMDRESNPTARAPDTSGSKPVANSVGSVLHSHDHLAAMIAATSRGQFSKHIVTRPLGTAETVLPRVGSVGSVVRGVEETLSPRLMDLRSRDVDPGVASLVALIEMNPVLGSVLVSGGIAARLIGAALSGARSSANTDSNATWMSEEWQSDGASMASGKQRIALGLPMDLLYEARKGPVKGDRLK